MSTIGTKLSPEDIERNYQKFCKHLENLGERAEPALKLASDLADRLSICPASSKVNYHNCFVGGLVEHSLRVLSTAATLSTSLKVDVSKQSLIVCCLFHDLGKLGDLTHDYYVPNTSNWHKENRGEIYMINPEIRFMSVPHRSLWLLQHYGVTLSHEEYLAILLHDGQYVDENRAYRLKEPALSDIVHMADYIAGKKEKGDL